MNTANNIDVSAMAAEKASAEVPNSIHHNELSSETSIGHEYAVEHTKEKDATVVTHDNMGTVAGSSKLATTVTCHADASTQHSQSVFQPASSSKHKPSFPDILHAILSNRSLIDIVTWLPSGKSFCILNRDKFTKKVLPMYLKETKFESFARRLKRWGFSRNYTTGQKQIVISHDLFQKDRLDLGKMMTTGKEENITTKAIVSAPHHPSAMNQVYDHRNILRNSLYPQTNNSTMMHPSFHARPFPLVPYMHEREVEVVNELTVLNQEIQDCQEQLAMLQRLRALREKRRFLI